MRTRTKDKVNERAEKKPKEKSNSAPQWPAGLCLSGDKDIGVSIAEDLAVVLSKDAFEQLFGWTYSTFREISCLGLVCRNGNRFLIERFYLLKQSGSSASTELDQSAIAELIEQLIAENKRKEAERIKCWIHSHPNMEAFWSETDDSTCRLLVNDYLVSIVVSSNFRVRCRIDITAPVPIILDNVPVLYRMPTDDSLLKKYAEQIKSTVSEAVFVSEAKKLQGQVENSNIPVFYCGYCGTRHAKGECPLGDVENWPQVPDDSDFMF